MWILRHQKTENPKKNHLLWQRRMEAYRIVIEIVHNNDFSSAIKKYVVISTKTLSSVSNQLSLVSCIRFVSKISAFGQISSKHRIVKQNTVTSNDLHCASRDLSKDTMKFRSIFIQPFIPETNLDGIAPLVKCTFL